MSERWYYQLGGKVIGPIKEAELRWLTGKGSILASTLVRQGEEGNWVPAVVVEELTELIQDPRTPEQTGPAEWYFARAGRRLGPVSFTFLKKLAAAGKLGPQELCWKEGTEAWQPVEEIPGLVHRGTPTPPISSHQPRGRFIKASDSWKIGLAGLLFLMIGGGGVWLATWVLAIRHEHGPADNRLLDSKQVPSSEGGLAANPNRTLVPGHAAGETIADPMLADAMGAIRAGELTRASGLLNRYISDPHAKNKDKALKLRDEVNLASSAENASNLAKGLSDEELREHLRDDAIALAGQLETPELRPIYQNTLIKAIRQEKSRRQLVPRDAIAQHPELGGDELDENRPLEPAPADKEAPRTRRSALEPGQARPVPGQPEALPVVGAQGPVAVLPRWAEIDEVMASPEKFRGRTISLKGVFKIGTRISEVGDAGGQVVGLSIALARNDDRTVCAADGRLGAKNLYMILEQSTAQTLRRAFEAVDLKPISKPTHRALLDVSVRQVVRGNRTSHHIVIESLEILGMCDYLRVARHDLVKAFRVIEVKGDGGSTRFGDGARWVEELGGEGKFVQPIRRKLRDLQRRAATDSRQAIMDRIYQRELSNAMSMANSYAAIRAIQNANWQRQIGAR
jgi:hypothetical protein